MATIGKNQFFEIKNGDGSSFHNLVLRKSAVESIVMSLGDKISGDVYYKDNSLSVTMHEYITYNGVNYMLINPPTIVREGVVSDNSELRGMTKYSFVFYHPMCQLSNFPFTDVAVTSDETRYLSESKVFSWIGKPADFVAKMNKNLVGTEWIVEVSSRFPQDKLDELSDVIPFDNATIADACKTFYDTWGVPYVVDKVASTEASYAAGKRFKLVMGLPSNEIYENASAEQQNIPFVFQMGYGVGLKNNSRTPRNNKIITRISGYGSENNIPYGYPQVRWYGTAGQSFTYGDHAGVYTDVTIGGVHFDKVVSYPIYKGILNGEYVELIKHPFTRTHLMPSVYRTTLFNKISLYDDLGEVNTDYNPDITLVDYYDAIYSAQYPYPNTINLQAPSYESHEFEDEKPELGEAHIINATPLNNDLTPASSWDDSLDDEGNYKQSYFQMVLPQLSFDLYACASITEEMQINMRSGACLGCTFTVQVDWDDYKRNFYDDEGNFAPNGSQRDLTKYPKSNQGSISLVLQKDNSTFGTLMPNMYQYPKGETASGAGDGDTFVILGISLPESYIFSAEDRLDVDMKSYMLENNVHYFDYPLKFDEDFLFHKEYILSQIRPNTVVRFNYAGQTQALFVKQITVKYGEQPLPQYDITLTDNVEVVLNQIGQVAEDVEKLSTLIAILRQSYGKNVWNELAKKLSKTQDDTAAGYITMLKGLQIGANFVPDILGEGGVLRMRDDGKVELVTDILYARMRAYFDSVVIREYRHESGNRIKSPAQGFNASRVENIKVVDNVETIVDDASEADFFRCYWRVDDGEKKAENQFVIGDLAFCEHADVVNGSLVTKRYWRVVTGRNAGNTTTADGEAWIDLSNAHDGNGNPVMTTITYEGQGGTTQTKSVLSFESGSGYPEAHDDICMLGCTTDTTRQGAIIEYVSGTDAPTYQIYQGLGSDASNPYSLNNKNQISIGYNSATGKAKMDVFGDAYIGDRNRSTYIEYKQGDGTAQNPPQLNIKAHVEFTNTDQELNALVQSHQRDDSYDDTEVRGLIGGLQEQIDGQIETWFYNYSPVNVDASGAPTSNVPLNVAPYSDWTTDNDKIAHLGDTFTNNSTGYCWRFTRNEETNAFEWVIIEDSAVIAALQNAARAQDTADHKRRVFICDSSHQTPTPPYDEGDLWVNVKYPWVTGETYDNEILKCVKSVPRTEEEQEVTTFSIDDWSVANGYTAKYNSIINNQYYQQLTGGTISQNITNAANAASAAKSAADDAQSTANAAQTSATAANNKLNTWADDGVISPTEKLALKNQKADVEKEYAQIIVDAAKYTGVSTTAFTTAYNKAITAFNYYTADSPEDITIITDEDEDSDETPRYSRISAYYAARQTVLNDFATAAKKYATDKAAEAAEAFKSDAVYRALKSALGSKTDIVGGLVLTSLIGMRQQGEGDTYTTWGGISGEYDALAKGGGIAAWYGGDMFDREDVDDSSSSEEDEEEEPRYATSLFRFDGSGYLASGNITWDENGQITIKNITTLSDSQNTNLLNELATFNKAFKFTTSGEGGATILSIDPQVQFSTLHIGGNTDNYLAATRKWVGDNYISKTWFNNILKVHYKATAEGADTTLSPNNSLPSGAVDISLESVFSFWTNYAISALGQGVDGSHAIGVLDDLSDVTISNPVTNQILKYNGTHWVNGAAPETYVLPTATANALGGIKIGYTTSGKNYAIALDANGKAYVNVPWTDHYDWGDITNTPTTIADYGITDAYTKTEVDSLARLKSVAFSSDGVLAFTLQDGSVSYVDLTHQHDFQEILERPTTLAGFGIDDAKIESGVITLGNNTITPVTSVAMTVPTGFSISGTPISKTGTLALSYSSGYEGFTTELKNMITALYSWFEVDSNGDIKTKDYTSNGTTKHRGFWSPSFISALGQGSDSGGGGQGDVTWELLKQADTRPINISHLTGALSGYATQSWVQSQGYITQAAVDVLEFLNTVTGGSDILTLTTNKGNSTIVDFTHNHEFLELTDRPTTIAGYGIEDAKIVNGVITLGTNTITPLTSHQSVTNNNISVTWDTETTIATIGSTAIKIKIPANPDTNTWRNIFKDGTEQLTTGINTKGLNFVGDGKTTITFLAAGTGNGQSGNANYATLKIGSTWRGIQDNLTSDSTTDSLSAKQGKVLKGSITTLEGYFTNGVAKSAAKLTTVSKTAWGQTFWTSGGVPTSISGALSSVTNITMSGYIKIGDAYLAYDSTNNAIKLYKLDANNQEIAANFYALGAISALGQGVDGGGGGQGDVTWEALHTQVTSSDRTIHSSYIADTLAGYSLTSHTHTTTITTDSGTNQLTLAYGTKYKITAGGTSFVFTMPSADDTNTWRNIYVAGTEKIGSAVNTKGLNFAAGSNVSLSFTAAGSGTGQNANYGTITISATDTTYSVATQSANGLMSAADKTKLDGLEYFNAASRSSDGVVTLTTNKSNTTILDLTHQHSFLELVDRPTTLAGYGITDAVASIVINGTSYLPTNKVVTLPVYTSIQVDALARLKTLALTNDGLLTFTHQDNSISVVDFSHEHSFLELIDRPTTVAGYGITDMSSQSVNYATSAGSVAWTNVSSRPTKLSQFTNDSGYVTSSGVTSVATGTGLTGGTITSTGTISINSTYQTYISHGESAYNSLGNYLLLSGGTMTGTLHVNNIEASNSQGLLAYHPAGWSYVSSSQWGLGALDSQGVIRSSNADLVHCKGGTNYNILDSSNYSSYALPLSGGDMNSGVRISASGGDLYIGNSSNSGWLMLQDVCSQAARGDTNWCIRTSGNAIFANVTSNGAVTALSDVRHKQVIRDTNLSVEQIANMPSVIFKWTDGKHDNDLHVGTLAQNWQQILPEVVLERQDEQHTLSLSYGVAALVSAITTARKVVDHEKEIAQLKNRVKALEDENKMLKTKLIA